MKSFSNWTIVEVEEVFQVEQKRSSDLLEAWLDSSSFTAQDHMTMLEILREELLDNVYDWNEYELKAKFIIPLLSMIKFDQPQYRTFFERSISAPYKNEKLSGEIDLIVAQGKRVPKQPYFFLHEYKKDVNSSGDPLGQLLVTMIAAQVLNENKHPIYGSYVVGRLWYFVVLDGKEFAVSLAYDSTKEEIKEIFGILQKTKTIIEDLIQRFGYD